MRFLPAFFVSLLLSGCLAAPGERSGAAISVGAPGASAGAVTASLDGASKAEVSRVLGPAGDTALLGGGEQCVTYVGASGGFTYAIFKSGRLDRLSENNFVTCTGDFN